ncbi:TetR/AcrR family transcriptional regulator C-terminal domain-containing protein [Streptomyces sp. NPDC046716]|uniref:TetR/AcrR family transcriptional regulator n=1 Tax=Streptomyces sp. NPDC046716 TaxID=3157093 RepID=UPI0033C7F039
MSASRAKAAPQAPARRGRPPSTSLNQGVILDAALALVDREGPDALTLRRLGADLGANHTAVLRHFAGKDEILLGLAERLIAEAMDGFAPSDGWRHTLESLARRMRAACLAHPRVAVLVATRVARRDAEFHGADVVVGALRRAGFGDRDAARYYRSLVDTSLALAAYEASVVALGSASREGDRLAWRREYLAVSPDRYPDLAAVAPHLAAADEDDQFETTLALLLDAVELRAARR